MSGRPLVCAHRGASVAYVENTMAAFAGAVEMGADMIETDIRRTRDGRLVLHHDPLPDSSSVEAHHLEELVEYASDRVALDIELKESGYEEQVLELLSPRPNGLLVSSFLPKAVSAVRAIDPSVWAGLIIGRAHSGDPIRAADACRADVLVVHSSVLTGQLTRRAAARGLGIFVWTVNHPEELRALMADESLLGVITDTPDVAVQVRAA
jgi:glycerophosphoryl diester phosphodiesterase